jgi:hypothetical protein
MDMVAMLNAGEYMGTIKRLHIKLMHIIQPVIKDNSTGILIAL